ncbi:sensor histidine kinase [Flavobacterium sp. 7A]|uniref:sensor histidine kinase n=1 Tax=Flavobacterium sp. 7A TaxID=2940571 RepID=UPI002225DEE4|nr:HAMP domain-containing sensor histidine kinase [Flavobacterium sp. 7A]MCW2118741.1 signal transduction histidine kinase [Flavobacterium sp. 7A]
MKLKNKISIVNILLGFFFILIFWFAIPYIVKEVIYKNIEKTSIEKREVFKKNIDNNTIENSDIKDFIKRNDSSEIFANFTTLHSEFVQLYQSKSNVLTPDYWVDEQRILDNQTIFFRVLYHEFSYKKVNYILEIGKNIDEIGELTKNLHYLLLLFFLISIVVNHFIQSLFVNYFLRPFKKLIDTKINKSDQPEAFDFSATESSTSEFIALDQGLNSMMHRIQNQFKKEKQFIANVSHELLTPISILKNRFENLINNPSLNDEAVDKIAISLKNVDTLKRIINNLLLISRIENNQYSNFELINLKEQLTEIINDLEDQIGDKNITIINALDTNCTFKGNRALLHILFYNIIINALKFTKSTGTIKIFEEHQNSQYSISIQDTGIGMTEAQTKIIFDRFIKINLEQDGQGLGLAIVSSIAHLHKIEIKVNAVLNEGTTFTFIFPN